MPAGYAITDYLFDRANIHDKVTSMTAFLDRRLFDRLANEVFAEEMIVDYTALFGGEPLAISGTAQAQSWKEMTDFIDSFQHASTAVLAELPQPSNEIDPPNEVDALANVIVNMVRKSAHGDPITSNGGYYSFKLIRTEPKNGGNPWRISFLKANLAWMAGNTTVSQNPNKVH